MDSNSTKEIWKELPGLVQHYTLKVSNKGRVMLSIKGSKDSDGTHCVNLDGILYSISDLVKMAFSPSYDDSNNRPQPTHPAQSPQRTPDVPVKETVNKPKESEQTFAPAATKDSNSQYTDTQVFRIPKRSHQSFIPRELNPDIPSEQLRTPTTQSPRPQQPKPVPSYMESDNNSITDIPVPHVSQHTIQTGSVFSSPPTAGSAKDMFSQLHRMRTSGIPSSQQPQIPTQLAPSLSELTMPDAPESSNMESNNESVTDIPVSSSQQTEEKERTAWNRKRYEGMTPIEKRLAKDRDRVERNMVKQPTATEFNSDKDYLAKSIIHEKDGTMSVYEQPDLSNTTYDNVDFDKLRMKVHKVREMSPDEMKGKGIKKPHGNRKRICCTLLDGSEKLFESVSDAAEWAGVDHSAISKCCRGKIGLIKGMRFRYVALDDIESVIDQYVMDIAAAESLMLNHKLQNPGKPGRPKGMTRECAALIKKKKEQDAIKKRQKKEEKRKQREEEAAASATRKAERERKAAENKEKKRHALELRQERLNEEMRKLNAQDAKETQQKNEQD